MRKTKIVFACAISITLVVGIVFGAIPLFHSWEQDMADKEEYEEILEEYTLQGEPVDDNGSDTETPSAEKSGSAGYATTRTIPDFEKLLRKNPDTVGWIQIPGTPINHPVVHSSDSQKYLDYNFNGHSSTYGAIFSTGSVEYNPPSQNITLFGHSFKRSRTKMFSSLVLYKDKDYYNAHPLIYFETPYQKGTYRIFAVFNIHVPGSSFNYTQSSFGSEESFLSFVQAVRSMALYDTGVNVTGSDEIITLSTCDRAFDNNTGRFVVMAVRVS